MKIKVKEIVKGCKFKSIKKGEWIDLRAAEPLIYNNPQSLTLKTVKDPSGVEYKVRDVVFKNYCIPLGIAMQLPKGFEAHILARSSTYENYHLIVPNSMGIIDYTYSGNDDEWKFPVIPLSEGSVKQFDRICQFRITLSQKATIWQKIRWMFTNKIEFEWVDNLNGVNRGGFGTTGIK